MSNIGFTEFLLIVVVALLLFGPQKLPEIGRALGKTMQEFKKGMQDITEDIKESDREQTNDSPIVDASQMNSPQAQPKSANLDKNRNLPE